MIHRSETKKVFVGNVQIGGNNEVVIQSMTTTKTRNIEETVAEILRLEAAGCQVVRCTIPTIEDAKAITEIKKRINIPLIADIHFDYNMALAAIDAGADKIRINPGNIGKRENIEKVVRACMEKNIPIRIGVNAGSLEKHIIDKYGYPTAEGMLESAKYNVSLLEDLGFHDIIISMKASNIDLAVKAYELAANEFNYPLHLGITEAGTIQAGTIKSAAGLGILLYKNIGSTIRVSLTADPTEEIKVAKILLKDFGLASNVATLVSCPTCGRIEIDLFAIAKEVEDFLETIPYNIHVAVLGCAVNGPGEARDADIGIAGARGEGLLFKKGKIVKKVKEEVMVEELKKEILLLVEEKKKEKK